MSHGIQDKIIIEYVSKDHGTQELRSFKITSLPNSKIILDWDIKEAVTEYNYIRLIEDETTQRYKVEFWYMNKQPGAVTLYSIEYLPMQNCNLSLDFKMETDD